MDPVACGEKMKRVEGLIETNTSRLNNHSDRIKDLENKVVGMEKDTNRLEQVIDKLESTIRSLEKTLNELKYRPLKFYEQVLMIVVSGVIGYALAKIFS